jgi:23S rRNA (uracil1939-C5)-methyltransferase
VSVCALFGLCGGCSLQGLSPDEYATRKRALVVDALARAGLGDVVVEMPLLVPERSRRRAVFKIARTGQDGEVRVEVGFHAARSHSIVDMTECLVLTPALFALTGTLRTGLMSILNTGEKADLHVTEADNGLELAFRWARKLTPRLTAEFAKAFAAKGIVRISVNGEIALETAQSYVMIAGARVILPPHAFLQATRDGERQLQEKVLALAKGKKKVADLFAGLGTFSLALARNARVHAVEQEAEALAALAGAARTTPGLKPITTERRDLFKQPLGPSELKAFDAVVLDPPRAGAQAQIRALADSPVGSVIYVSCDAASFARDAAILKQAGFRPGPVTPIDQFLYSGHIELVGGFERTS